MRTATSAGRLTASVDSVVQRAGHQRHTSSRATTPLTARVFGVGGSVQLPYVPRRFGALVSFDTVLVRLDGKDFDRRRHRRRAHGARLVGGPQLQPLPPQAGARTT
ncbi:MAG: hypothetical protein WKG07_41580 [Hymenobacter sp.]